MADEAAPIMLSIRDAVRVAGIGRTKIYELVGKGLVRAVKCGSKTLVVAQSLRGYLDSLPSVPIKRTGIKASKRKTSDRMTARPEPA
jgi:hypothetical protein